jgi:hypothetical protein
MMSLVITTLDGIKNQNSPDDDRSGSDCGSTGLRPDDSYGDRGRGGAAVAAGSHHGQAPLKMLLVTNRICPRMRRIETMVHDSCPIW